MIAGSLEIQLLANIARLQADMDRARQVVGGAMDRIGNSVETVKNAFKGFIALEAIQYLIAFVKGVRDMFLGSIDAAAGMNDLAIQTGASAAALMAFKEIGATSDTTVESMVGAMGKLAKGMAVATEESKGLPQALKAIGIDFDALKAMSPDQQMIAIAKGFDQFADGAGKSAAAMAIYGKEGMKMLPFLADLAAESDSVTKALTAQEIASKASLAGMSDSFGDNMTKIGQSMNESRKAISFGMLPALFEMSEAFKAVMTESGGVKDLIAGLAADGTITKWARSGAIGLTYLLDGFERVYRFVSILKTIVGGALSTMATFVTGSASAMKSFIEGDYSKSFAMMKQTALASVGVVKDAATDVGALLTDDLIGTKLRAQMEAAKNAGTAAAEVKKQLNFDGNGPDKDAAAAAKKEADAYATLMTAIRAKTEENRMELLMGENISESQKMAIKLDEELRTGKLKLTAAHETTARAALVEMAVTEQLVKQQTAQRDVDKYIAASAAARDESTASLNAEYAAYGKSADAREMLMVTVKAQADTQKKLSELELAHLPISDRMRKQLDAEEKARIRVGEAAIGQGKALQYAAQLADENKKFAAESIYDEKARAAALLAIDADMWQERIELAGAGTEAQKRLQDEYNIWYGNQTLKPQIDAQKKMWDSIETTAHDTFVSIFDSGKSTFDRLRDTLKNGLMDLLYQMTVKKWVMSISASVGLTGASGLAEAAGTATGTGTSGASGLIGIAQTASNMYKAITGGFEALGDGVAGYVQQGLSAAGYTPTAASGLSTAGGQALTPFASQVGQVAGAAAAYMAGSALNKAISGQYSTGSGFMTAQKVATAVASYVNPVLGVAVGAISGLINRAFGMGNTEVKSQGLSGTLSSAGVTGNTYQNLHQDGGWFRSDKNWTDKTALTAEVTAQFTQGFEAIKSASAGFATSIGASVDSLAAYSKTFDIALTSDTAANEKAIADFFTGVGDEIALRLVPGLAQFNKSGETMAATLQRLAGDFDATNQVAMLLGKNGTSMFGSLTISSAAARERLIELAGGVSNLTTQATGFAQNYLSEAERLAPVSEAVAAAMASLGLASVTTREQFKTVVQSLDVTTAAGAQQFASMMALSDAFAQVHPAIEATTAALRTEADVLSERKDLQKQIDQLTLTSVQLRAKERAAIDASNVTLFDQITALQNAATMSDTLKTSIDSLKAFRDGILSFKDSLAMGSLSTLTPMQKAFEAQRQYEEMLGKANSGDATARSGINAAATAYLTANQAINASSSAYVATYAKVQSDLESLAAVAGTQLTDAQQQLAALDQQVSQLASLNATASNIEAALTMPTPVLNWSEVGTTNMAPLTEEIKGLRADNEELRADNAALLAAVNRQTDAVVAATLAAADNNAKAVTAGAEQVAKSGNWMQQLVAEVAQA
jgi:hypothetical protein